MCVHWKSSMWRRSGEKAGSLGARRENKEEKVEKVRKRSDFVSLERRWPSWGWRSPSLHYGPSIMVSSIIIHSPSIVVSYGLQQPLSNEGEHVHQLNLSKKLGFQRSHQTSRSHTEWRQWGWHNNQDRLKVRGHGSFFYVPLKPPDFQNTPSIRWGQHWD